LSPTKNRKRLVGAGVTSVAVAVSLGFATIGVAGASLASSPRVVHHNTAIPQAVALLKALKIRPTKIPVSAKITRKIPRNRTIDFVVCGVPQCAILVSPLAAAAKELGWKVKQIPGGLSPSSIQAAWTQVVSNKPGAAMGTGFPEVLFSSQVAQLKAMHIPVINGFVTDSAGGGVSAVVNGTPSYTKGGSSLADFVLGTDGTKSDSLFVGGSTFPASGFEESAYLTQSSKLCAKCATYHIDPPATESSSQLITDIEAQISAHPHINFVVCSQPTQAAGLPQALKLAGHGSVKIVVNTPDPTTLGYLKAGTIAGIMAEPNTDAMDEMADALWRTLVHQSVKPSEGGGGDWAVTKSTAHLVTYPYYLVPGALAQYAKLWK